MNCGIVTLVSFVTNYVQIRINGGLQSNSFQLLPARPTTPEYVPDIESQDTSLTRYLITPCVQANAPVVRNPQQSGVPGEFCENNSVEVTIDGRVEVYAVPISLARYPLAVSLNLLVLRSGVVLLENNGNIVWSEFKSPQ
jgi:hypothetical protein